MKKIIGLDTLRFLAFLAIFVFHSVDSFPYGYLGVDFFFVLSSFLLTYLAYREKDKTGGFSQKNFFVRRALRIFPLYYLIIAGSFLLLPLLSTYFSWDPKLPDNKLLYWFFLSNYELTDCLYYLKFYWSIAVEEQFYLMFLGLSFLFRKNPLLIIGILSGIYISATLVNHYYSLYPYLSTVSHFPNFALGVAGGFIYFKKIDTKYYPLFGIAITSILLPFTYESAIFDTILSIFFLSVILSVTKYGHYIEHYASFKLSEKLGEYTYGLYMYSGIVMTLSALALPQLKPIALLFINLPLIILTAVLSYHLYEKHFLKLKSKFRR